MCGYRIEAYDVKVQKKEVLSWNSITHQTNSEQHCRKVFVH